MTTRSDTGAQGLLPSFAPSFLDDHARRLITDPRIALVEVIANCWDAGADRVDVTWPVSAVPDLIEVRDNGMGMTYEQFTHRWLQLNYNRPKEQGEDVEFPPGNQSSHRRAFGRNGKGRHSMFCFANEYRVETWRDGEANRFSVKRATSIEATLYRVTHLSRASQEGHGTIVSAELARNYLGVTEVRDLIGSKFVTDPSFNVYVNGELVELTDLEHLIDVTEIDVPEVGTIRASQVDTQRTSKTSHPHGVAWWVNRRLVGEPSWGDFDEDVFIDRRTVEAKRYTFVIEVDPLVDDVLEDWSGFRNTERVRSVREEVGEHIRQRLADLMRDVYGARKRAVLEENADDLAGLSPDSRYQIGRLVDGIQHRMPSVGERVLSVTVKVLSNLEKARTGYALLEQLAKLGPEDLDQLNEILERWTVQEARIVLSELGRRLGLIERLEQLVEDPSSDELHDLHPLFARALWVFGPEYESIHFTSNQTLLTVVRRLLPDGAPPQLASPRRRPDFVALPDRTVGVYASDAFDENSEVSGFDKILIVELKRGGSTITLKERRQGEDYAKELLRSGKVQDRTKIVVFVLGTEVDHEVGHPLQEGNTTVCVRPYAVVLQQAHARTFHLLEKIREAKQADLLDPEVERAITRRRQPELFAPGRN